MHALRNGFGGLLRFSGREGRQSFWLYIAAIVGLTVIAGFAVLLPAMSGSIERMQRFAIKHPEQATVSSTAGSYSTQIQGAHPELMPDMSGLITIQIVISVIAVFLMSAAIVRRLHDRDRAGLWGLMPVPFLAIGLIAMRALTAGFGTKQEPDIRLFALLFLNNIVYLATLIALIVLLAAAGDPAENRFGPPPL